MRTDPPIPVFDSRSMTAQLFRIASRDSLTKAYISAWQAGVFPSFEAMLISLTCAMYDRCAEDEKGAGDATARRSAGNPLVGGIGERAVPPDVSLLLRPRHQDAVGAPAVGSSVRSSHADRAGAIPLRPTHLVPS